jgi:hypothetical protein
VSHWTDEYMTLIEDCENRSDRLTDWEADFVDSLRRRLEDGNNLTPRQLETLENLWEKVTKRG